MKGRRKKRKLAKMETTLAELQEQLLSGGTCNPRQHFVNIKDNLFISTISSNTESQNTPVVGLHGFGGACAMWLHNIDCIAKDRPFYAIDMPGFGRSSRCEFSQNAEEIEEEFIGYLEAWRKEMELESFILMGHSFGGYIASLYALSHPDRVRHLLLVDPWGYVSRPTDDYLRQRLGRIGYFMFCNVAPRINPFSMTRFLGMKYGPWVFSKIRPDLAEMLSHDNADTDAVSRYFVYCNSITPPSGETAFAQLANDLFWARNPLLLRMMALPDTVPMTFLYGELSWNTAAIAYTVKQLRALSYVDVQIIHDAGHHVYADQWPLFNPIVSKVCHQVDEGKWDVTSPSKHQT